MSLSTQAALQELERMVEQAEGLHTTSAAAQEEAAQLQEAVTHTKRACSGITPSQGKALAEQWSVRIRLRRELAGPLHTSLKNSMTELNAVRLCDEAKQLVAHLQDTVEEELSRPLRPETAERCQTILLTISLVDASISLVRNQATELKRRLKKLMESISTTLTNLARIEQNIDVLKLAFIRTGRAVGDNGRD